MRKTLALSVFLVLALPAMALGAEKTPEEKKAEKMKDVAKWVGAKEGELTDANLLDKVHEHLNKDVKIVTESSGFAALGRLKDTYPYVFWGIWGLMALEALIIIWLFMTRKAST